MDSGWSFLEGDHDGAQQVNYDARGWRHVELPHDWSVEQPVDEANPRDNGYFQRGMGWYRRTLLLDRSYSPREIYVEFEGVYRNSTFWVNGREVGRHLSGYTGVVYDITSYVHCDGRANLLALRVNGRENEGWWYEGNGIYRHVWLVATDRVHVANWGVFVTTPQVSGKSATVSVKTSLQNDNPTDQRCHVTSRVLDVDGGTVASVTSEETVDAGAPCDISRELAVANPHLWSPDTPYLYVLRTEVEVGGRRVDETETPFGARWFEFTADKGFFLNGEHLQLRGMCIHHDFGGLGVALPDRANEKTVEVMKQMGCNLLRSSHNDPAPYLLDACDRLGLLVWAETRYLEPSKMARESLRDMIRRDRDHPSIICWSLANTAGSKDGAATEVLKDLNRLAHEEDPSRPTAFACEGNADANANGFALVTDIMGYNGGGMGIDDRDHGLYPQRRMLISEFSSGRGARGIYEERALAQTSTETLGDGRTVTKGGRYCSTYDLCLSHEREWAHVAERPWLAGGAMWSGIDYAGESCGWPTVTSQFGVLDRCRLPNDAFFFYLQEWTNAPMVHILPHWTWPGREGKEINVWCYSNCDAVELYLNGRALGVRRCQPHTHVAWKVPYQFGALSARALRGGKVVCSDEVRTAGSPARIQLSADRESIRSDGRDLSFITVKVLDGKGNLVPVATNGITVKVKGPGRLIGLCSGDPASHENAKASSMKAFSGQLVCIVQNDGQPGAILVQATSPGLSDGTLQVHGAEKLASE